MPALRLQLSARPQWRDVEAGAETPATRRFVMEAYNGGKLRLPGFQYPVVIDLQGLDCSDQQRPILLQHDKTPGGIVGRSDKITNDGRRVTVEGVVFPDVAAGSLVTGTADKGFPWESSVGVPIQAEETVAPGQLVSVNGQSFTGPLTVVRKGWMREVSFCVFGADNTSSATLVASEGNAMTFEEWVASKFAGATFDEAQLAELRKSYDAMMAGANADASEQTKEGEGEPKPKPGAEASARPDGRTVEATADKAIEAQNQKIAANLERVNAIQKACDGYPAIEAQAIRENWTPDQARLKVLEAQAPTWSTVRGKGDRAWTSTARVIEAAICRMAMPSARLEKAFDEKTLEAADGKEFRDLSFGKVFGMFVQSHGGHAAPGRITEDHIEAAVRIDRRLRNEDVVEADGGFSTVSLPGILSNAANKILLDSYQPIVDPIPKFCSQVDAQDFKQFKSYRMTGSGDLQGVGATGELKTISLQEETYTNQLATKGAILTLNRQMIINDDLNAFAQVPAVLGRMAADSLLLAVVQLLMANTGSFFHANNNNLLTGGGSALNDAGLAASEKAFWELKDANGVPILVPPKRLLVPAALKKTATDFFASPLAPQYSTTAKVPASNSFQGLYEPVTVPYLGTAFAARTGQAGSNTRWWHVADPASGVAVINVAYLRGRRSPTVEQGDTPFNTLGMQWRIYFDFGVAFGDTRAGVQNDGA